MTSEAKPRIKVTYATLRADNEDLHSGFEEALTRVRAGLGGHHQNYIGGQWRDADSSFEVRSPIDRDVLLGTFATGTTGDLDDAVAAARQAQPAWAAVPWKERLAILRRAAELISDRLMDYSAAMSIEVGKNRIESLGEVEESADLIRYYAQTMEDNAGYDHPMDNLGDSAVHTRSILRPHGVFAVVSPFNFPMALATGPSSAAMMAGNTVVIKPASASPLSSVNMLQAYIDAGVPAGVVNLVMGPGESVGQALQDHAGIDGIVFTGSYEVGMRLFRSFSKDWPRPCIVEMGGKNPAIVSRHADLDEAAEGDHALRVRVRWPEVLGELAGLCRAAGPRRVRGQAGREDRGHRHRRPARPRELARADHRPEGGRPAPGGRRRGAPRRHGVHRRRAPGRRRPQPAGSTSSRRSSAGCRPTTACSATSSSRR